MTQRAPGTPLPFAVKRRRVKMARPVRVRPSSPNDEQFDEVRTTLSASPTGLFFTTWRDAYYRGQRVFVTYPYAAGADNRTNEYLGEILSIAPIEGTLRRGVAVRFLSGLNEGL